MGVEKEIGIVYWGREGLVKDVGLEKVNEFEGSLVELVERDYEMEVVDVLKWGVMDENVWKKIEERGGKGGKEFM